jgi:hypothetical protein
VKTKRIILNIIQTKNMKTLQSASLNLRNSAMKTTLKNYFGLVLLITSMLFTVKALLMLWHFLAHIL